MGEGFSLRRISSASSAMALQASNSRNASLVRGRGELRSNLTQQGDFHLAAVCVGSLPVLNHQPCSRALSMAPRIAETRPGSVGTVRTGHCSHTCPGWSSVDNGLFSKSCSGERTRSPQALTGGLLLMLPGPTSSSRSARALPSDHPRSF